MPAFPRTSGKRALNRDMSDPMTTRILPLPGRFKRFRVVRLVSQLFRRRRRTHQLPALTGKTFALPPFTISPPYPLSVNFAAMSLTLSCRYLRVSPDEETDDPVAMATSLISLGSDVLYEDNGPEDERSSGRPSCNKDNSYFDAFYHRPRSHDSVFRHHDFRPRKLIRLTPGMENNKSDRNPLLMSSGSGSSLMDISNAALRSELESKMFVRAKRLNSGTNDPLSSSRIRAESTPSPVPGSSNGATTTAVSYLSNAADSTSMERHIATKTVSGTTTASSSSLSSQRTLHNYSLLRAATTYSPQGQDPVFQVILPSSHANTELSHEASKHRIAIRPKNRRPKSFQPHASFDICEAIFNRKTYNAAPPPIATQTTATVLSEVQSTYEVLSRVPEPLDSKQPQPSSTTVVQDPAIRKIASTMKYSKSFHLPRRPSAEFTPPAKPLAVSPRLGRLQTAPTDENGQPPPVPPKLSSLTTPSSDFNAAFSKVRRRVEPVSATTCSGALQREELISSASPVIPADAAPQLPQKIDTGSDIDASRPNRDKNPTGDSSQKEVVLEPTTFLQKYAFLVKDNGNYSNDKGYSPESSKVVTDSSHRLMETTVTTSGSNIPAPSVPFGRQSTTPLVTEKDALKEPVIRRGIAEGSHGAARLLESINDSIIPAPSTTVFPDKSVISGANLSRREFTYRRGSRDIEAFSDPLHRSSENISNNSTIQPASVPLATTLPLKSVTASKDAEKVILNRRGSRDNVSGNLGFPHGLHESSTSSTLLSTAPVPSAPASVVKSNGAKDTGRDLFIRRGSRDVVEASSESLNSLTENSTSMSSTAPSSLANTFPLKNTFIPKDNGQDFGNRRFSRGGLDTSTDSLHRLQEVPSAPSSAAPHAFLPSLLPQKAAFAVKDTGRNAYTKRWSRDFTESSPDLTNRQSGGDPFSTGAVAVSVTSIPPVRPEFGKDNFNSRRWSRDITEAVPEPVQRLRGSSTTVNSLPSFVPVPTKTASVEKVPAVDIGVKRGSQINAGTDSFHHSSSNSSTPASSAEIPTQPFPGFSFTKRRTFQQSVSSESDISSQTDRVLPIATMEIKPDQDLPAVASAESKTGLPVTKPIPRPRVNPGLNNQGEQELFKVLAKRHATLDGDVVNGETTETPSDGGPVKVRSNSFKENYVVAIPHAEFGSRRSVFADVPSQSRDSTATLPARKISVDKENFPAAPNAAVPTLTAEPVRPVRSSSLLKKDFFRDPESEIKRLEDHGTRSKSFRSIFLDPPANFSNDSATVPTAVPVIPHEKLSFTPTMENTSHADSPPESSSPTHDNENTQPAGPMTVSSRAALFQQKTVPFKPLSSRNRPISESIPIATPLRMALKTRQASSFDDILKPEPGTPESSPPTTASIQSEPPSDDVISSPPVACISTVPPVPLKLSTSQLPKASIQVSCGTLTNTVPAWVALAQEKRKRIGLLTGKVDVTSSDSDSPAPVC